MIEAMWAALAEYQPQADANGHGKTWARMCSEKTAAAAVVAAAYADAAAADVTRAYDATAYAAAAALHTAARAAAAADADADCWAQRAIDKINKARRKTHD